MKKNVRVGVGVFVFKGGEFLVLQRQGAHGAGTWSVPGGHLEAQESFEETARREVHEETGVEMDVSERDACSHRRLAIEDLLPQLRKIA